MSRGRNTLALRVGDREYGGWKSITVSRSLEQAVSQFELEAAPLGPANTEAVPVRVDDPCEIRIGPSCVLTGYIDEYEPYHDATSHTVRVAGRSRTADLVDCSCIAPSDGPLHFRDRTLPQVAEALCAPYGVTVVDQVGLTDRIAKVRPEVGERVWELLERLARDQGVLVTDNAQGELVFARRGDVRLPALRHPGNILTARLVATSSQRFSEYRVKAQNVGSDENFGAVVAGVSAFAEDDEVRRRRVLVLPGERAMDAAAARRRAIWEAVTRAGRSVQVEIEVAGWRAPDGVLWEPNGLARVRDGVIGVDADLLLVGIGWTLDAETGRRTKLLFAPPGAYEPEPPTAQRRKGKRVTSGVGAWKELEGGV